MPSIIADPATTALNQSIIESICKAPTHNNPDYYEVLGITRCATDIEIKTAFRRLVLQNHPDNCSTSSSVNKVPKDSGIYYAICESFDILSQAETRAVYDLFGRYGLENGIPKQSESKPGYKGYKYHGDPNRTFREFFGGDNVFYEVFKEYTYNTKLGTQNSPTNILNVGELVKQPPIEKDIQVTMNEVYTGTTKLIPHTRRIVSAIDPTPVDSVHELHVVIYPGMKNHSRIVFPEYGDSVPNTISGDLVFIVKIIPDAKFQLSHQNSDLLYTHTISLNRALCGSILELDTLDGRQLKIPLFEVIHPMYVKKIENEGMPIFKSPSELGSKPSGKGNLVIKFNIVFPTYLNSSQKKLIDDAFQVRKNSV